MDVEVSVRNDKIFNLHLASGEELLIQHFLEDTNNPARRKKNPERRPNS